MKQIKHWNIWKARKGKRTFPASDPDPHLPYELVPDKYYKQYENMPVHFRENVPQEKRTPEMETITRQYFAAVTGVDEQFGRILQYLKDNHLEEDTLVVLSADHGEMLGSHGRMSKNVWYEESIHRFPSIYGRRVTLHREGIRSFLQARTTCPPFWDFRTFRCRILVRALIMPHVSGEKGARRLRMHFCVLIRECRKW